MSSSSLPSTYSVWRRTGKHSIDGGLELQKDVPLPKPGRGQVLVRIYACSLNYRDLLILKGQYGSGRSLTETGIPLSDGAGEVVALGEGVKDWKVGSRVAATFTPSLVGGGTLRHEGVLKSAARSLGGDFEGTLAQYFVADETGLVDIGDLPFEEAATLPCAAVTAWNALYGGQHPLRPGHVVLVQGTGGVSVVAAQIALAAGARVIATSSSDEKLARLEKLGVKKSDLINYKKHPKWSEQVLALTDGKGVDHVVEVGGPGTAEQSVASVRMNGEIAVIGMLAGSEGSINPLSLLFKGASMRGILIGTREQFRDLLDAIHHNGIRAVVDKVFPFEQAAEAFKYLESGAHFGKIVIKVA